jgi:1-acyl-sn-glycerol-3-phosphate acyltransferase
MAASGKKPNLFNRTIQFMASVYFWVELFGISAILFTLAFVIFLFTAPFDRRRFILHKYTCFWSLIILKVNPMWRVTVTGRKKIKPRETYVMVSNHQSGADIIVLFMLWAHFKWIAKKSLFNYPFIGWDMWLNGYIAVDRAKSSSMKKMMEEAGKALKEKNSLMVFPEGTRSKDGRLQNFKTGAFHLALDNKVPIVPIVITGTSKAIRKGGFLINKNFGIRATVLDPIPFAQFSEMNPKEVTDMVHSIISRELDRQSCHSDI